jgi:alkylation response protein AidB-like acyl-CoA dehydrogenase
MSRYLPDDAREFQAQVRAFLRSAVPEDIRRAVSEENATLSREQQQRWQRILAARGWGGPGLPREWGGPGWTEAEYYIFLRELALADAPRLMTYGLKLLAPVLIAYGTDEQRRRFLPGIISGNTLWCQTFSEPEAGSDLAALGCRAERDREGYVIDGAKIWTTEAHIADWTFGLFRTSVAAAKKQQGITFLTVDLRSPGVTVKPLKLLDGSHEVNEVVFDHVRVPEENRIGAEGQGWEIAKYLLGQERLDSAELPRTQRSLERLRSLVAFKESGNVGSRESAAHSWLKLAQLAADLSVLQALEERMLFGADANPTSAAPAVLKLLGTQLQQDVFEAQLDEVGAASQREIAHADPPHTQCDADSVVAFAARSFYRWRVVSIYGGSNEILRNILARAVLDLR